MTGEASRPDIDIFQDPTWLGRCHSALYDYLERTGPDGPVRDRMEAMLQLSRAEMDIGNAVKSEALLNACEEYIIKNGREEEKACVHNIYALMYATQAKYAEGISHALQAVYLFGQTPYRYYSMNSLIACGHLCAQMCLFTEAIDYMSQAYEVAIEIGNKKQAIICMMNLNEIRLDMLPPGDCIQHCLDLLPKISDLYQDEPSYAEACTYLQMAHLYITAGEVEQASLCVDRSMSVTGQLTLPPYHLQYINLYAVKAEISGVFEEEEALLRYTAQTVELAKTVRNIGVLIESRFFLFRFYLGKKQTDTARIYLDEAVEMVPPEERSLLYLHLHESFYAYYAAIGDLANELASSKLIYEHKIKMQQETITYRVKYMSAVHELEIRKKEMAWQKSELDFKTQELNMTTYYLQQRNRLLTDLKENIAELKKSRSKADAVFMSLSMKIDHAFSKEEAEKALFKEKFDEINREFIARLHQMYPALSSGECRMCALLRAGFNTKEITNLLSTSVRNVENHRLRIRKKMNLNRDENLNLVLTAVK